MNGETVYIQHYDSPCGKMVLASVGDELCLCDWSEMPCAERNMHRLARLMHASFKIESTSVLEQAMAQLNEYFAGTRTTFTIPLRPVGTDFQQRVWNALLQIPYGATRSYKDIALSVGNPKAVRAVAQAIGANGISIFIPCHRVIGTNHTLTGYAGGLPTKHTLLSLENPPMP